MTKMMSRTDRRIYLGLLVIMLLALALRVYRLDGQSLWSDEGLSLYRSRLTLAENLSNIIVVPPGVPTRDTNPPLYFIALSGWRAITGESEYALRFLSVIAGVILVPLLYNLARRLWSPAAGLTAATLGAISPFFVWYSQEARMYTLLAVLSVASVYALARALDPATKHPLRRWGIWVFVTTAALYTHFTAFFLLPFEGLWITAVLLRVRWRMAIGAALLLGALGVPIALYGLTRAQSGVERSFGFRPLSSILEEMASTLAVGRTNEFFQPLAMVLPGVLLSGLGAAAGLVKDLRSTLVAGFYLVVPLLAFYAVTFIEPLFSGSRHLILIAPPFYLLVGQGIAVLGQRWRWAGGVALAVVAALMANWLSVQFFDPAYRKDDMRSAAQTIAAQAAADDVVIVHDAISSFVFDYYYDGVAPWRIIPAYPSREVEPALTEFQAAAQAAQRVWFVTDPAPLSGFPSNVLDEWARGHLLRLDNQSYPSIWLGSAYQLYTAHFPVFEALPATAQARSLRWPAAALSLRGGEPIGVAATRTTAQVQLYWQLAQPAPFNLVFTLRLVDESGAEWGLHVGTAFDNWSVRQWPTGKLIQHSAMLDLPRGLPPGHYRLLVKVASRQTETPLHTSTGAEEVEVASIDVAPYPSAK